MLTLDIKKEEDNIFDLAEAKPIVKDKKFLDYTLNENKALAKMKDNLGRGKVTVEDTPKKGAKIMTMNPGEFKEVMDVLTNLQVGQKFSVDNVNVSVSENVEGEEKTSRKVQLKIVLRLNRRTVPTFTTSPTIHIYPTDQKLMIQGSFQAKSMAEKEFLLPLLEKVLSGKEASVGAFNQKVAKTEIISNKRKKVYYPCDYCDTSFPSITAI
jgi:hypothetical protein